MITLLILVSLPASFSNALYDRYVACAPLPFKCGDLEFTVAYPFNMDFRPTFCGHPDFNLYCNDNSTLTTTINSKVYQVIRPIDYENGIITIIDPDFANQSCPNKLANTTIDTSLYFVSSSDRNVTLYLNCTTPSQVSGVYGIGCLSGIYGQHSYLRVDNGALGDVMGQCSSTIAVPVAQEAAEQLASSSIGLGEALQEGFHLTWLAGMGWCGSNCIDSGGFCGYNSGLPNEHICFCRHGLTIDSCSGNNGRKRIITAIVATGTTASILACAICIFCYRQKQKRHSSSTVPFKSFSSDSPSEKGPESVSSGYQIHLFSYDELLEATNSFDASKELGDGGFGTVYKGKLRDGRVVAVKRLYDNNYKRVEQFLNEVVILSQLRHRSLVTLYGCTSRRSRGLLLVYEFISNGTVADHLHGSPSPDPALTWPLRLRIAIESADALAYLHAIDPPIIHRDVKTTNILLDDDFHVKVADFGLSRLFPVDATHVSTAPQGTPGYVDPEYHQYYQLTDKSDVYSFGVVLIELISSKPAVDVSRHRDEINLSSMAMKKIQEGKLDHLVDPALGFESDMEVRRMITVVAELAFRCLQIDREMRPTIKEVLEELRRIESGDYREEEKGGKYSGELFSPDTVIERWSSRSSTPSTRSG